MKKQHTIIAVLILLLSSVSLNAQQIRNVDNKAYTFGEYLEYNVGMIGGPLAGLGGSGGISVSQKPAQVTLASGEKHDCYEFNFWVNSEGIVNTLYGVHDRYRAIADMQGIYSYEFNQRIREGKYKRDFKATFDQANHLANVGNKSYKVDGNAMDILTAFFYFRTLDLSSMKSGDVIELQNFYKDKMHSLPVRIIKRENITVPAGTFKTIRVQPLVTEGGLFKSSQIIIIWLTDDELKIPVRVATSIVIGDVGAELRKYSGVKGKVHAKVK
jgi:hypothetical protein